MSESTKSIEEIDEILKSTGHKDIYKDIIQNVDNNYEQ